MTEQTTNNSLSNTTTMQIPQQQYHSPSKQFSTATSSDSIAVTGVQLLRKEKFELSIADEAVVKLFEKVNRQLAGIPREVEYSFHRKDGRMIIKIMNSDTKEIIKEIPPEKILDLLDKLQELASSAGTIIDEKR